MRDHNSRPDRPRPGFAGRLSLAMAMAMVSLGGCAEPQADSARPEAAAPPEGVYGTAPAAVAGTPSAITLYPPAPVDLPARPSPRMDQLGLAFTPSALLARVGESVTFTNSETISHNVTLMDSDTNEILLDADTDPTGHVDFVFEREGGYEVTCELHPGMRAFVYVTSAPYATFADNAGGFRITGVPPGSYTLSIWSVDPALRSVHTIEVTGPSTEVP